MASITPHRDGFRAQVFVEGKRSSKVLPTRKEAAQWALEAEAQLRGVRVPDKTLGDACARWELEEADKRGGGRSERIRLARFRKDDPLAKRRLEALDATDFAGWRDDRLKEVKPGTVAREMNTLRSVLELARREWCWIKENPMRDVRWPKLPKGRARGVSPEEVEAIAQALGVWDKLQSSLQRHRVGLAFLFALETGMRSGEICALRWQDIHLSERYVSVVKSKNGDARDVPLTLRAGEILKALPVCFGPAFGLTDAKRDALFRKHRPASCAGVHFHDTRSEAISRLSKKMDIYELARVIGHRDLNSLLIYYKTSAAELARKLG